MFCWITHQAWRSFSAMKLPLMLFGFFTWKQLKCWSPCHGVILDTFRCPHKCRRGRALGRAGAVTPLSSGTEILVTAVAFGRMRFSLGALHDVFRMLSHIRGFLWQRPGFCDETLVLTISGRFSDPQELESCVGEGLWTEKAKQETQLLKLMELLQCPGALSEPADCAAAHKPRLGVQFLRHCCPAALLLPVLADPCPQGGQRFEVWKDLTHFTCLLGCTKAMTFYQKIWSNWCPGVVMCSCCKK